MKRAKLHRNWSSAVNKVADPARACAWNAAALTTFHPDEHPSFSVFHDPDKGWHWKSHRGCGEGDQIDFLCKGRGIPKPKAMSIYLEMAGFPDREFRLFGSSPRLLFSSIT